MRILTDKQEKLLVDSRQSLNDLRTSLMQFGATLEDQDTLARSIDQLDDLFLLVVVGEFNSGKVLSSMHCWGRRCSKKV
jgi:hypothetical protein